jgi:hypothetical protein
MIGGLCPFLTGLLTFSLLSEVPDAGREAARPAASAGRGHIGSMPGTVCYSGRWRGLPRSCVRRPGP